MLVVDDEPMLLTLLERLLGRVGFSVLTAESIADALVVLDNWCVSVVVADFHLGGAPGDTLLEAVRSWHRGVPVVLFSADPAVGTRADELGVPFVEKGSPRSFDDLVRVLKKLSGMTP